MGLHEVWASNQMFKKEGLTGSQFLKGVLGKRGWLFSGGLQFLHKSKLKSGPYYQKHVNQMSLNFEFHNSLMLSFTDNGGFHSNFVYCESFLKSNSPDILVPCKTNLDDSIDSDNFSVRGYLPLIQKDTSTHIHGLAVMCRKDFLLYVPYL